MAMAAVTGGPREPVRVLPQRRSRPVSVDLSLLTFALLQSVPG